MAGAEAERALVGQLRVELHRAAGAAGLARRPRSSGIVGGVAPTVPGYRRHRVRADHALDVAAGGGELVGAGADLGNRERVRDHPEHVGVLEDQRAPAERVERVPEGPDARAVAVGDGADGAERDVAGGQRRGHRRAGHERLLGEAAERAGRRGEHGALRPVAARPQHEVARARARARRRRARRASGPPTSARRVGAGGGWSRSISSIGVTSTTWFPYSPTLSEIAPALRRTPPGARARIGEPEKPGPMPVASTAGPDARTRMRGPLSPAWVPITSRTSTSNCEIVVPRTTDSAGALHPRSAPATGA